MHNLALLLVCQTVTTLGLMVFVPIMPLYMETLTGVNAVDAAHWGSLALAAPAVGTLFFAPYAGKWCDRFGYRQMLLASLAVFIASMSLMALSSSVHGFLLGRLLQGISAIGVVLTAFIGYVSNDDSRGRSLGLQEGQFGALGGPLLGGIMLDYWSLKPLLLGSAVLTGIAGGILWSQLSEPGNEPGKALGIPGSAFSGVRTMLGHSYLRNWMLAACLIQAAAFAFVTVFALYLTALFPTSEAMASKIGLLHALGWLATMLAAPLWGHLNDCSEPRRYFILAAMGCALSTALLTAVAQIWLVALLRLAQGACYAALMQSVFLACSRQLPESSYGHMTGLSRSFMVVGQLLGPLLIMLLLPILSPVNLVWPVAVLFFLGGLLILIAGYSFAELKK